MEEEEEGEEEQEEEEEVSIHYKSAEPEATAII